MDPISIISLTAAIVSAIFAITGPIFRPLWRKLKSMYGRSCQTTSYLTGLGRQRLTKDIQHLMARDSGLRASAHNYYIVQGNQGGYSSDFSDF